MRNITVFLASSEELIEDRRAVGDLFQFLNNIYTERGVFLRLETWEYGSSAIVNGRKQDEYNQLIRDSDLCFFLFCTKAGQYTLEEFDAALSSFKEAGRPKIAIFVRDVPNGQTIDADLSAFLHHLEQDLGHFWNRYNGDAIQAQYDDLQARFVADPANPDLFKEFGAVATRHQELLDELADAQ